MLSAEYRNVNEAFNSVISGIHTGHIPTVKTTSRNGDVLQVEGVSVITYTTPRERVLFNEARDANPFFHMYESLWMLAGRNDVSSLSLYSSKIADIASDDGEIFNGAYGNRWRNAWVSWSEQTNSTRRVDQLDELIAHLKEHPDSRRAVLQMWNVEDDLLKIDSRNGEYSKDVCCNLSVCFSLREDMVTGAIVLDMTVFNRSNDLILGSMGANVVHFSFLQEYVANCLDVCVGKYSQVSNNLHCYVSNWHPEKWLSASVYPENHMGYPDLTLSPKLVKNKEVFDKEVKEFCEKMGSLIGTYSPHMSNHIRPWKEPWLHHVAHPMMIAYMNHRLRRYGESLWWMEKVLSRDWRIDGLRWIKHRKYCWETRMIAKGIQERQKEKDK